MKRYIKNLLIFLLIAMFFSMNFTSALAQGTTPPVDANGAWGEVMNPDGSINYGNLTDGGVVTEPADWMPNIPIVGPMEAEYHVYYTPSGNTILMPTASTLFFMAASPSESGYDAAASVLGTGGLGVTSGDGGFTVGAASLGVIYSQLMEGTFDPQSLDTYTSDFFGDVFSGDQNIWSFLPDGLGDFLGGLFNQTSTDFINGEGLNLYTYMLLYPPGQCVSVPGGCTPEQLALITTLITPPDDEDLPPAPGDCPAPVVTPGRISRSGQLVAPNYPLVVGQDPDKRGVDIAISVSVAPTIRTYWTPKPITECKAGPNANGATNCTMSNGGPGHEKVVDWTCEQHTETYNECISFASTTLRLTSESKDWILNELAIRYPNAYVHKPTISLGTQNACQVDETYEHIQTADPGYWDITISGQTSGTPVSAPRPFGGAAGQFGVWLKEIAIIK